MALLTVHTFPDPVLKQKALPVDEFDEKLSELAENMLETMYEERGIGLAAVQVAVLKQLVVVDLKSGEEDISSVNRGFLSIPESLIEAEKLFRKRAA